MTLDATYDSLLRLLANRGLEWIRQRVASRAGPLALNDPDLHHHAMVARLAPVLSGLRGSPSPLEKTAFQLFDRRIALRIAARACHPGSSPDLFAPLLTAGRMQAGDEPQWMLARQHLAANPPRDLAERLALCDLPTPDLMAEAETLITSPMPDPALSARHIDLVARVLAELYHYGAKRPKFSRVRVFGDAYSNCLHFADWAQRNQSLVSVAQMVYCLRLIDPDHDVAPLLANIIPFQRPDGSFPRRTASSGEGQGLDEGLTPTLAAVAALHIATYRRWRAAEAAPGAGISPIHAARDRLVQRVEAYLPLQGQSIGMSQTLQIAVRLSVATGQDVFTRLGLRGSVPSLRDLRAMALGLAGHETAARHARAALALDAPMQRALARPEDEGGDMLAPAAICWLQAAPLPEAVGGHHDLLLRWDAAAMASDRESFLRCCRLAAMTRCAGATAAIRGFARHLAQRDQRAISARPRAPLAELLDRLDRLSLLAILFEPKVSLAAAA